LPVLWGPGAKPFEGTTLSVPEAVCYPRPLQPRIPVVVGGRGEQRTMRLAAELADGWNLTSSDPETLARKLEVLHAHCRTVDRDPADLSVSVLDATVVGRDRTEVGELVERVRNRRPAKEVAARLKAGTTSDTITRYRRLVELGVDRVYVSLAGLEGARTVERFAPVVDAFV
jgi:alkanesulfonate monooxygenase SsuD/methylene tetrahydromethanopterin reductase-like flavin-dependent oxidoreductase (luciferase family)